MKRIEVAVGIVRDEQQRVLVGQRVVRDQYYQKWEFPGGKLESGETAVTALNRELGEELGIQVLETKPLITLDHDYPDRHVRLKVFAVTVYSGVVAGREGQALQWLAVDDLAELDFLQGNQPIIEQLLID